MKPDEMKAALRRLFLPQPRGRGFKGALPHFRRIRNDRIDLLTVQFDRSGGGFVIEIARCSPSGVTMPWGLHIPPGKVSAWDLNPGERHRLGSPKRGEDGRWFRFDNGTPVDAVAKSAALYLEEADCWWESAANQ